MRRPRRPRGSRNAIDFPNSEPLATIPAQSVPIPESIFFIVGQEPISMQNQYQKALIFDLDNCLAPANEIGEELFAPAFDAIRRANRGTLSESSLQEAFADIWRHPLDWVAAHHGFSQEMTDAGWQVFAVTEIEQPMHGYDDLHVLSDLPAERFLVTSGFRRLQESKIRALNFRTWFVAAFVDAIDEPNRKGKEGIFREILETYQLAPADVFVVGDNPDSEIEAGNRLGLTTVQILRPGVPRADNATLYIHSLIELNEHLQSES